MSTQRRTRREAARQSEAQRRKVRRERERKTTVGIRQRLASLLSLRRSLYILAALGLVGLVAAPASSLGPFTQNPQEVTPMATSSPKQYSAPPPMSIDAQKSYTAIIETQRGNITLELFAKDAPKTVNNFVFLAREKFYDGITFHRVIADFMAQGGDPKGDGTGGPGYKFEDEFSDKHLFDKEGVLAMANSGPNTNGSQFFITYGPQPHLNGKHTIFGQVTQGMDVLKPAFNGDKILAVTVEEK